MEKFKKTSIFIFLFLLPFSLLSFPEKEFLLGAKIAEKVEEIYKVEENSPEVNLINRIGVRISSALPASYPFTFVVIKEKRANAFSIPGGFIYVTSGIFKLKPTDCELAFLLGHEITHTEKRHVFKMRKIENLINVLLFSIGMPLLEKAESGSEAQSEVKVLRLTNLLLQRRYSRKNEEEADYWGRFYALKAGYRDCAKSFFEKLDFWKEKKPETVYLLYQTHPFVEEREKKVSQKWKEFKYPHPTSEKTKKWIDKVQKFLWKESTKLNKKGKNIVLRNLYFLSPDTPLAGESVYSRWKEKIKNREENKEYYKIFNSGEIILKKYPELKEKKNLKKKIKEYEKKYVEEKRKWEEKIGKVENTMFYEKFLSLFPDSSIRKIAYMKLVSLYKKGKCYKDALKTILRMEKEEFNYPFKEIEKIVDKTNDLKSLVEYYSFHKNKKVRKKIELLLPQSKDLKTLKKLKDISNGNLLKKTSNKIRELSKKIYERGKLEELSGNMKEGEDLYWEILEFAPESPQAEMIRKDLKRKEFLRGKEK